MRTFFIIIAFNTFCFGQKYLKEPGNIFSDNYILTVNGMATSGITDYTKAKIGLGAAFSAEYFLPSYFNSSLGFKIYAAGLNVYGRQADRIPEIFRTDILNAGAGLVYNYSINGKIYPQIYGGIGYIMFDPKTENGKLAPGNSYNLYEKNSLLYEGEINVRFPVSSNFLITTGVGIHFTNTDNLDDIEWGISNDYFMTVSLGFSIMLFSNMDKDNDGIKDRYDNCVNVPEDIDNYEDDDGCPEVDNDGDKIVDLKDRCPNQEEDFDGFEDEDGCPELDNDKDGILDKDDKCPNFAEDIDGYEDIDGCPDLDNDSDGIIDENDKCTNAAEDFDNFQDEDGCPELDNDSDGIPDNADKCPDLPETLNGKDDTDGCPDGPDQIISNQPNKENNVELKKNTTETTLEGIPDNFLLHGEKTFVSNSAEIKSDIRKELNRIAGLMKKYPTEKWRIEGYMDNEGKPDWIKDISQKRAVAIKNYLISKGVPSKNLQAIGMGDTNPIESNDKVFGRMRNKRVEIKRTR